MAEENKNTVNNQKAKIEPAVKLALDEKENMTFSEKMTDLLSNKVVGKLNKTKENKPKVEEVKEPEYEGQQTEKLFTLKDITSNMTPAKALKIFGALLMIVMIIAALYVKFIRKTPVRTTPTLVTVPTPTYSPYQLYKPSIYAEDANFKKIDEGLNILENEVNNVTLDEGSLLPQNLDFSINFK